MDRQPIVITFKLEKQKQSPITPIQDFIYDIMEYYVRKEIESFESKIPSVFPTIKEDPNEDNY